MLGAPAPIGTMELRNIGPSEVGIKDRLGTPSSACMSLDIGAALGLIRSGPPHW